MRAVVTCLAILAVASIHLLIGGTRLVFALPCFALLAIAGVLSLAVRARGTPPPNWLPVWAGFAFFGYIMVRASLSPIEYLAWPDLTLAAACLVLYTLSVFVAAENRYRVWFLVALLALAVSDVATGIRQFRGVDDWMPFGFLRPEDYRGRASGAYICPNHLAAFLNMVALFSVAGAFWFRTSRALRLLLAGLAVASFAGLILTASRGGFLSFGAGALVLAVLVWQRLREFDALPARKQSWLFIAVLSGLGFVALWTLVAQSDFLSQRARRLADQSDSRLLLWPAAVDQFKLAPVLGTGAGTYLYYGRQFRRVGIYLDPIHVHNDYLHLAAEYGVIGCLLGGAFLFLHLGSGWRAHRLLLGRRSGFGPGGGGSNSAALNQGALAATVALAAHSVLDFNLHIPSNALALAWVAGVLASPGVARSEGLRATSVLAVFLPRFAAALVAIALGWFAASIAPGEWFAEEARVALREGQPAVALGLANQGLAYESRNPALQSHLGDARWRLAELATNPVIGHSFAVAARSAFTAALRLFPTDSRTLLKLAWADSMLGDFPRAEEEFLRCLYLDPRNPVVWKVYGHHLRRAGRPEGAREAYKRSLALAFDAEARTNLTELEKTGGVK